jgi:hypothetical protein
MLPRDIWPSAGDQPPRPPMPRQRTTRAGRWIAGLSPTQRLVLAAGAIAILAVGNQTLAALGIASRVGGVFNALGPGGLSALLCGAMVAWVVYLNLR